MPYFHGYFRTLRHFQNSNPLVSPNTINGNSQEKQLNLMFYVPLKLGGQITLVIKAGVHPFSITLYTGSAKTLSQHPRRTILDCSTHFTAPHHHHQP